MNQTRPVARFSHHFGSLCYRSVPRAIFLPALPSMWPPKKPSRSTDSVFWAAAMR